MMFQTFAKPFLSPFPSTTAATSVWYLSGGISATNCIVAYLPKGAASLAVSYVNLANPGTYNASVISVAPTLDASGWVFNGSTQFLTTSYQVPSVVSTMLIRFSNFVDGGILCGVVDSGGSIPRSFEISPSYSSMTVYGHGTGLLQPSAGIAAGVMGIANKTAYKNAVSDGTIGGGTTMPAYDVYIGGLNLNGGLTLPASCKVQAVAIYDIELSGSQITAVTNAMNAL